MRATVSGVTTEAASISTATSIPSTVTTRSPRLSDGAATTSCPSDRSARVNADAPCAVRLAFVVLATTGTIVERWSMDTNK